MDFFNVPIISYHKISDEREFGITTLSPAKFESQLEFLKSNNYDTITFAKPDFAANKKPVIITFDDAFESVYSNAFPLLKKYGFKSVIFTIAGYIGKTSDWEAYPVQRRFRHMNPGMLGEMLRSGHEIGSHSMTHPYLPGLTTTKIYIELRQSKQVLEDILKTEIISICYPYGKFNNTIISQAEKAGYLVGTTNLSIKKRIGNNLCIKRRSIYSFDSLNSFKTKISITNLNKLSNFIEWSAQRGAYVGILKKYLTY